MKKNTRWMFTLALMALGLAGSPAALANHGAGMDGDADGVPDSEDWCLNTPAGTNVGNDGCGTAEVGAWNTQGGCSARSTPHAAGVDGDNDGVPDSEDWCLGSTGAVGTDGCGKGQVGARGACLAGKGMARPAEAPAKPRPVVVGSKDADKDGVGDADDNCPGTAPGVIVDDEGCAVIEKVVLKGVNFATGSATLKASAHDILRSVAATMKGDEDIEIEVQGHTDSQGTDENNMKLSQRRADSVKSFLVKEGIAASRITAKGYGESQPVDSNDTPAGKANNRRVAFKVTAD